MRRKKGSHYLDFQGLSSNANLEYPLIRECGKGSDSSSGISVLPIILRQRLAQTAIFRVATHVSSRTARLRSRGWEDG